MTPRSGSASGTWGPRTIVIEGVIWLAWVILEGADAVLRVLGAVCGLHTLCFGRPRNKKEQHVVIVGASFGGLTAQRELSGRRDVKVTLIDFKDYFEYTPGILRCFVQPSYLKELTCPLPASRNKLLRGAVCAASEEAVTLRDVRGEEQKVSFDYLVLAVGSTYAEPIKPLESEPTLAERASAWDDAAAKLAGASTVIIVGAGPVGVELAGEILTVYPDKAVTFVDMAPTILPGFDEAAAAYTKAWFRARGAQMRLGEGIAEIRSSSLTLRSGEVLEADVVYKCVGVMPNTAMLKASPIFNGSFGFRDSIEVNDHLQVAGNSHVYCVGDMSAPPALPCHSATPCSFAHSFSRHHALSIPRPVLPRCAVARWDGARARALLPPRARGDEETCTVRLSVWLAEGNRRVRRRTLPSHGGPNEVDTRVRHCLSRTRTRAASHGIRPTRYPELRLSTRTHPSPPSRQPSPALDQCRTRAVSLSWGTRRR